MDLTSKQKLFIDEYLKDRNGKQAAIRAGYAPKSAEVQASKMLRKGKVYDAMHGKLQESAKDAGIDRERVLRELSKGAFVDIDATEWKPSDKLKALEIICKLLGYMDGKGKDDGRDSTADARRILEAIGRIKREPKADEKSDKGKV